MTYAADELLNNVLEEMTYEAGDLSKLQQQLISDFLNYPEAKSRLYAAVGRKIQYEAMGKDLSDLTSHHQLVVKAAINQRLPEFYHLIGLDDLKQEPDKVRQAQGLATVFMELCQLVIEIKDLESNDNAYANFPDNSNNQVFPAGDNTYEPPVVINAPKQNPAGCLTGCLIFLLFPILMVILIGSTGGSGGSGGGSYYDGSYWDDDDDWGSSWDDDDGWDSWDSGSDSYFDDW